MKQDAAQDSPQSVLFFVIHQMAPLAGLANVVIGIIIGIGSSKFAAMFAGLSASLRV
jgi:hypothetical protein